MWLKHCDKYIKMDNIYILFQNKLPCSFFLEKETAIKRDMDVWA